MKTINHTPDKTFHLQVGDKVNHIKETNCSVLWSDCTKEETAWTNKLVKIEKYQK